MGVSRAGDVTDVRHRQGASARPRRCRRAPYRWCTSTPTGSPAHVELDDLDLDTDLDAAAVVIEWGEGVAEQLADDRLIVELARLPDDTRTAVLTPVGSSWVRGPGRPRSLRRDGRPGTARVLTVRGRSGPRVAVRPAARLRSGGSRMFVAPLARHPDRSGEAAG